jgi:hypothetical protein
MFAEKLFQSIMVDTNKKVAVGLSHKGAPSEITSLFFEQDKQESSCGVFLYRKL